MDNPTHARNSVTFSAAQLKYLKKKRMVKLKTSDNITNVFLYFLYLDIPIDERYVIDVLAISNNA
jgi:hypothetical protein